jgi:hypothetical protein
MTIIGREKSSSPGSVNAILPPVWCLIQAILCPGWMASSVIGLMHMDDILSLVEPVPRLC